MHRKWTASHKRCESKRHLTPNSKEQDGRELWTANAQDGTLSVVDLTTRNVTATLDSQTFGANRLKFTPDGKLVLISTLGGGDLVIYDTASRKDSNG